MSKSYSKEYKVWSQMNNRCHNPNDKSYSRYGGNGIHVCARWCRGGNGFDNFFADMGPRPSDLHSIERVNNYGPYSPENCRWATIDEQVRNRRSNVNVTINGRTMCAKDWARELGVDYENALNRIKRGWSPSEAFEKSSEDARKIGAAKTHAYLRANPDANKARTDKNKKHVVCVDTGLRFESVADAALYAGRARNSMSAHLNGSQQTCGGKTFRFSE